MILQALKLTRFKNIETCSLRFEPGILIFWGRNGTGKTNLLEAISMAALGSSPRQGWTGSAIQWGKDTARIEASFEMETKSRRSVTIGMQRKKTKKITVDGTQQKRRSQMVLSFPLVHCFSEDVDLIHREPDLRRRFLNFLCMRVETRYLSSYKRYQRLLRQRNHALRAKMSDGLNEVYEQQFAESAAQIIQMRRRAVNRLEANLKLLPLSRGKVTVAYAANVGEESEGDELVETIREELRKRREQEKIRLFTMVGPHRDDLTIRFADRRIRGVASRGELKFTVLQLKAAEAATVADTADTQPIVLLDDILSEMDEERQEQALALLAGRSQAFLTTCDFGRSLKNAARAVYRVEEGGRFGRSEPRWECRSNG